MLNVASAIQRFCLPASYLQRVQIASQNEGHSSASSSVNGEARRSSPARRRIRCPVRPEAFHRDGQQQQPRSRPSSSACSGRLSRLSKGDPTLVGAELADPLADVRRDACVHTDLQKVKTSLSPLRPDRVLFVERRGIRVPRLRRSARAFATWPALDVYLVGDQSDILRWLSLYEDEIGVSAQRR